MSARDHVQPELFPDVPRTQPNLQQRAGRQVANQSDRLFDRKFDPEDPDSDEGWQASQLEAAKTRVIPQMVSELSNRTPATRMESRHIPSMLDHGFLNQYSTGGSNGSYNPKLRLREERRMHGYSDTHPDELAQGPVHTTDQNNRPVYGYMSGEKDSHSHDADVDDYGDVVMHLKPSVADRTTVTVGDSLAAGSKAMALHKARRGDVTPQGVMPSYEDANNVGPGDLMEHVGFIEAQYHGGLSKHDVEHAAFNSRGPVGHDLQALRDSAQESLQEHGVPYRQVEGSGTFQRQGELAQRVYGQGTRGWKAINFNDDTSSNDDVPDWQHTAYGHPQYGGEEVPFTSRAWQPGMSEPAVREPITRIDRQVFLEKARQAHPWPEKP